MGRGRPTKCPKCGSRRNISKGFRYRESGKSKDRKCKDCGRRFYVKVK